MSGPVLVGGERDDTMRPACCRQVAERVRGHYLEVQGASPWGLVLNRRARWTGTCPTSSAGSPL
jgi:hypothetical protein